MGGLQTIDAAILAGYLALLLAVGFWSGRNKSEAKAEDFFLTSKTLPWYTIGFSLIAAGISSVQFIGNVGYAYQHGLAVANWEWLNAPAILLLVFIFIPVYSRWKIVTMPQFLELRYNGRVRTVFAIITLLTYIFINMAGVIYSGGFVLNKILGLDLYVGIWTMAVVSGFFVVYGGMESIAWTNVLQAVLLLGSGLLVFVVGFAAVPGGWAEIIGTGDRSHLILPASHKEIPSTGLVVLALSTNIWFFCTNQTINQSALGAKNLWHAKMGVLLAGFLSIVIAFADVFPGMIAYALNPNLPGGRRSLPVHCRPGDPGGGSGGWCSRGCWGLPLPTWKPWATPRPRSSRFDIYRSVINPRATERQLIRIGRVAAVVVLVVGAVWAPIVMRFGHIFSYFQECWAFHRHPGGGALYAGRAVEGRYGAVGPVDALPLLPDAGAAVRAAHLRGHLERVQRGGHRADLHPAVYGTHQPGDAGRQRRQNHRGHLEPGADAEAKRCPGTGAYRSGRRSWPGCTWRCTRFSGRGS
jgi:SSS family solute:Na+ symporter